MMSGKILIVDDDKEMLSILAARFSAQDYEVTLACDGLEALESFARCRPDVVLLDIRMPRMDGFSVLRQMRGMAPDARVVMISGELNMSIEDLVLGEGALGFVSKPFDFDRLERTVKASLPPRSGMN